MEKICFFKTNIKSFPRVPGSIVIPKKFVDDLFRVALIAP